MVEADKGHDRTKVLSLKVHQAKLGGYLTLAWFVLLAQRTHFTHRGCSGTTWCFEITITSSFSVYRVATEYTNEDEDVGKFSY